MPARLIEEALRTWRDGERLLAELSPLDPDHEAVRLAIDQLRTTYTRLTNTPGLTAEALESHRATIATAVETIVKVREQRNYR